MIEDRMHKRIKRLKLVENQRGDTLISVALSVAVVSLVVVIAYILINQSLNLSQQAREREQVKNLVQGQVESLKYIALKDDSGALFKFDKTEYFCLNDDFHFSTDVKVGIFQLEAPVTDDLEDPNKDHPSVIEAIPSNDKVFIHVSPPGYFMAPLMPECEKLPTLEAADVQIWINYDRDGVGGDPGDIGDDDEEHLFKVIAKWDKVGGGSKEQLIVPIRIRPLRNEP